MNRSIFAIVIITLLGSFSAFGQEESEKKKSKVQLAEVFTSTGEVTIGGKPIRYTAKAGSMLITDNDRKPMANFGFTAYISTNSTDAKRPIVFAYNGGPGSASFWLHLGVLGPKRVKINDPDFTTPAPFELVKNEYSILGDADLVMIDPVGTGISIPQGDYAFKDFWGVDQDIKSISNFIRQYLLENDRMNSPKYLLGESYGTFRNAGIMNYMQGRGIPMNGVIMVSAVFDVRQLMFPVGDDLPYLVHFPTYAATSWYHKKLPGNTQELNPFLDEIRAFTKGEYATALFAGDQLGEAEKRSMSEKLAKYTGLSSDYWYRADLRVQAGEYFAELMRDEGKTVGRLDSRFTGQIQDPLSQYADYDPQSSAISGPYITAFLDYYYNELGVDTHYKYMTTAGQRDGFKWDWSHVGNVNWGANAAISTAGDLATALKKNPNAKVLILNGIFDLATVFFGVEYTIDHLGLPKELKDNIIMKYYEAGHMMYTHEPSLEQFHREVSEFIEATK